MMAGHGLCDGEARHHAGRLPAARPGRLLHRMPGTAQGEEALRELPVGGGRGDVGLPALLRLQRPRQQNPHHRRGGADGAQVHRGDVPHLPAPDAGHDHQGQPDPGRQPLGSRLMEETATSGSRGGQGDLLEVVAATPLTCADFCTSWADLRLCGLSGISRCRCLARSIFPDPPQGRLILPSRGPCGVQTQGVGHGPSAPLCCAQYAAGRPSQAGERLAGFDHLKRKLGWGTLFRCQVKKRTL